MTDSQAARDHLWRLGVLAWKLRPHQSSVIHHYRAYKGDKFVWVASRQSGKTHGLCTLVIEEAMRGKRVFYGAYSLKAAKSIVRPTIAAILADAPKDLRPEFHAQDGEYHFPGGGSITLGGLDDERAEDWRGRTADLIVIDEAGFISDLAYKVKSILFPMTKTTGGKILIASTPPTTPGHDFVGLAREAEAEGGYVRKTIYDDTSVDERTIARLIKECGGVDTIHFRREHLCEFLVDEEWAVVPEFTEQRAEALVKEFPLPQYFNPFVAMDVGFQDPSAVLFGFYDFRRAVLCVQDEFLIKRMTTDDLAAGIKLKETALWKDRPVFARFSDIDLIVIHDLSQLHGLHFVPTAKDNLEAQVNVLRMWVKDGRIEIHPRCVHLIRQLKTGVWDRSRKSFERTASDGHFDALAAMIYMVRNTPVHSNPYPALDPSLTAHTHWIPPQATTTPSDRVLSGLFKRRTG